MPPSAASLITEINFTVTRSGLEGQLLGVTLEHEQPELEKQKSKTLAEEEQFKMQLAKLEEELVQALASSTGDILSNTALMESLTKTKAMSADIAQALAVSAEASTQLDRQREVYRPFAAAGSVLYFLMADLRRVQHMYQFSLASFVELFQGTLDLPTDGTSSVEDRMDLLIKQLQTRVLFFVGRSLFKADRLMFAMHLVHCTCPDMFGENEWRYFVGDLLPDLNGTASRDFPMWAAADRLSQFNLLMQTFPSLVRTCNFTDSSTWGRWATSPTAEHDFPPGVARDLSPFQRLIIVQTLRPDRLVTGMEAFVAEVLGVANITPPPTDLAKLAGEEAKPTKPVLMITTTGADPSKDLEEFAANTIGRAAYSELAMGGGQQAEALRLLKAAAANGKWLCLKNLHLVVGWLPALEKALNALDKPHPRFRLWLTTEAHHKFPTILLQTSIKVTFEAPPGVKKNLERIYNAWSPEFIGKGSVVRAQMLFMLAWYHAVLQERRTYVPQGWTKAYEFSFGDLRAGVSLIEALLEQAGDLRDPANIPWRFIHGLIENAIYGGRVDNTHDMRCLIAYLKQVFSPDLLSGRGVTLYRDLDVPATKDHAAFLSTISRLPDSDSPRLFGLPDNIARSVQRATSAGVIASLKALGAGVIGAASFDREQWREKLSPVVDMWAKLVSEHVTMLDPHGAVLAAREDISLKDPVTQFVIMEHASAAELVANVNRNIESIKSVLFGTGLLTPDIQSQATALMAERMPRQWMAAWDGPEVRAVC